MSKSNNQDIQTYKHKYQHYLFECELHPDDSKEELEKQMEEMHLNK